MTESRIRPDGPATVLEGFGTPELTDEAEIEVEVIGSLPGPLAVGVIDRVPTIKEVGETLIRETEAIRHRWASG